MVFGKKRELCGSIMQQFRDRDVEKQYLCIVDGVKAGAVVGDAFFVDAPIQRHETVRFVRKVGDKGDDWKHATTKFRILGISEPHEMMVLEATPKTGRTHQIRIHAQHAGYPIVGDDLYNPKE